MRMLTIAMRAPFGLETASSAGATKDASRGVLFSDSLEQAGGLRATSTASATRSVRQGDDEARTAKDGRSPNTQEPAFSLKQEFAELSGEEFGVTAGHMSPRSAALSLSATNEDASEIVTEETVVRTSELKLPASDLSQKPIGPTLAVIEGKDGGEASVLETSKANVVAGSVIVRQKPTATLPDSPSSITASPSLVLAGDAALLTSRNTPVKPEPAVDGAGEKKTDTSEKVKNNGPLATPAKKEKLVSDLALQTSSSLLLVSVPWAGAKGPAVSHETKEERAAADEGAKGNRDAVGNVGTKQADGLDGRHKKSKSVSADASSAVAGNTDPGSTAGDVIHGSALTVASEAATLVTPATIPVPKTSFTGSSESLIGGTHSRVAAVQIVAKTTGPAMGPQSGAGAASPSTVVEVPTSLGGQRTVAVPDAVNRSPLLTASAITGPVAGQVSDEFAALSSTPHKSRVVAVSNGRKSAERGTNGIESNVSGTAVSQDPPSIVKDGRVVLGAC